MLKESQEPLGLLRERMAKELVILAELESKFEASYFKTRAKNVAMDLRAVESSFLATFDKSTRTPFEEEQGLRCAESFIQIALLPQLRQLQEIFEKYGPTVIVFPPE